MTDRRPASRPRRGRILGTLVALALLTPLALVAQSATPRRADGRPDLSGFFSSATLTPLVRPREHGDRLELSDEEAAEIARHKAELYAKDYAPSDPDREAPPVGGARIFDPSLEGASGGSGGYNAFYLDPGETAFRINGRYRTSILVDPPDGQFPPRTAAAIEQARASAADSHENTGTAWWLGRDSGPYDNPEQRPLAERCILGFGSTAGPPMMPVLYNNLKRVVQTDDHLLILIEMAHEARIIRIDGEHNPADLPNWTGDSVGHWEGDTLVVETRHLREGFRAPASPGLTVTERFSRMADGNLLYRFTVDDPATWTAPWTGEYAWTATGDRVYEYACHEGNYALGNIMRGARLLEREALSGNASTGD